MTAFRNFARLSLIVVMACGGESTEPTPTGGDRLSGAPGDPAVAAIGRRPYEPRVEDFSLGHPELPGMLMSHRVAIAAIRSNATVGEVNALLVELDAEVAGGIPGRTDQAAGLLALRLPLMTHAAMEAALTSIRARPFVESAVQDMELGTTDVTAQNGGTPAAWIWDSTGIQDTWGLVAIRVPQLWNFNTSIRSANQPQVLTGVLDVGFAEGHEDLPIFQYLGVHAVHDHGAHVAGTIGAAFNNQKGIDGVNPFSALVTRVVFNSGPAMTYAAALWGLEDLIVGQPGLRVVNLSLGYNWYLRTPVIDVRTSVAAQSKAATNGAQVLTVLAALEAQGYRLPFIAAAAGNDSRVLPGVDARYGSPFANAALAQGAAPITVVEADSLVAGAAASYVRSDFSNSNGHLSAPGSQIWSSVPGGYAAFSGTSMATPHVSGLVGYLYALAPALPAPSLTTNPVRDLLIANLQPGLRNGRPQVDAFASALALDGLLGGDAILRRLVDIDDGTSDGNLRLDAAGAIVVSDDRAADNGRIDMADFRRWRDWLLQVESAAGLALDGALDHPKKDPNGDGAAGTAPQYEALYSRGDFNGDGRIDRVGRRPVPGASGAGPRTDLEVLQVLFNDPNYAPAELAGLVSSGDIHVDATDCSALDGAQRTLTTVRLPGGGAEIGSARIHSPVSPVEILTLPAQSTYDVVLEVSDAVGTTIGTAVLQVDLALGEDVHLRPECEPPVGATITLGWGGEPMGGEIRLYAADRSTAGGQTCNVLYQPIPVPPVSSASTCQLGGASANGSWTTSISASTGGPVTLTVSGVINMSQGASVDGNAWEAFASSALSAYFIVNGGTAEYELTGSVQVSGYQGSTWNLDAIVVFNSSQGPIINAVAGGCHRPEGCAPATVPLSGSGTIAPGIYSIGGILRAGTGSITPDARSGTAQFTYQLTLRP